RPASLRFQLPTQCHLGGMSPRHCRSLPGPAHRKGGGVVSANLEWLLAESLPGAGAYGWQRLLVSLSGLVYWGGVLVQARRVRRKIGRTPNLKPKGAKERALWVGWTLVVLGWIAQPFWIGSGHSWSDPLPAL